MGFQLDVSVPALTVFLQGLLSFFSPCVLPLIPLYIGYLSGGTGKKGEDGRIYYDHKKVMIHTLCFVLGISTTFFILGLGVSALGTFFHSNQMLFARIGGVIVILFGLYQLGIFGTSKVLGKERRLPFHINVLAMSPVAAYVMGFTFSFAWTPCVGPALASVLLMAASASTRTLAFLLIGVYTLGFVLPFLAVGLFTTSLLDLFKKHGHVVQYAVKIGAVLMIVMGLLMVTGKMNEVSGFFTEIASGEDTGKQNEIPETEAVIVETEESTEETLAEETTEEETTEEETTVAETEAETTEAVETEADPDALPALDFELKDQYGNTHTMEQYKGKTVFLNFWATWCPPCRNEMPDIQKIYEEYQANEDDSVVILGVASPGVGNEKDEAGITAFLNDHGYTYPVVFDTDGILAASYGIYSYPTTFMIDTNGNVFGYASGQLSEEVIRDIIQQTIEGKHRS